MLNWNVRLLINFERVTDEHSNQYNYRVIEGKLIIEL